MPEESHHFSDYGFDPQIDYFQVLEEARKHRRDNNDNNNSMAARSIDSLHFKLQKPISNFKDDDSKQNKVKWWRNAILFLRRRLIQGSRRLPYDDRIEENRYLGSKSGPVYLTESRSGSNSPYRSSRGPASGPLNTPARIGVDVEIPYISLRDLNMDNELYKGTNNNNSAMPIYLVT
ncbi:uncharacterized protein LOC124939461 [Impatiens glandulifera]|uniref:uncharacterized protein LOC124939461 n=1 Tax=Impatiens glandulifera TaxID=253017 RepID=UPI001FB113FC|nr:uncharacterized protein LOC124939461 [Impatiens glandulifera]